MTKLKHLQRHFACHNYFAKPKSSVVSMWFIVLLNSLTYVLLYVLWYSMRKQQCINKIFNSNFCTFRDNLHRMITTFHGVTISASCTSTLRRFTSSFYCAVFYPQERRTYVQTNTSVWKCTSSKETVLSVRSNQPACLADVPYVQTYIQTDK